MINISKNDLRIIKNILKTHIPGCEVRVFGSRYIGNAREYSDLDIIVVGKSKLGLTALSDLKELFAESDLPFRVDILDWHAVTQEFRNVIEKSGYKVIQTGIY